MALKSHTTTDKVITYRNNQYRLNVDGEIRLLTTGELIRLPRSEIFELMALNFKYLDESIPEETQFEVIGFPLDGDWENRHASNVGYKFKGGKLENPKYPGFYIIPSHPCRSINYGGEIIGSINGKSYSWSVSGSGYLSHQSTVSTGIITINLHRAMLFTFKDIPLNVAYLEGNHEDGNKLNNELDNLEWVTPSGNIKHAWDNDLIDQTKYMHAIVVRYAKTGSVYEYRSQKACAEDLGILEKTLEYRLKHKDFSRVWADGYQFKYANDERDWVIPDDVEAEILKGTNQIKAGCKIRNCLTLEVTVLDSVNGAYRVMGCGQRTPHNLLKQQRYKPYEGFQIIPDDGTEFPEFSDLELSNSYSCFSSYDLKTRQIYIAKSLKHMSDVTGLDPRAIEREASYGDKGYGGYLFIRGPAYRHTDFTGDI